MNSLITDFLAENTSIIIIIICFAFCILVGYFGDKRFKANNILEKKKDDNLQDDSSNDSNIALSEEASSIQTQDEIIKMDVETESEIPVFEWNDTNNIQTNNYNDAIVQNEINNSELNQFIDDALSSTNLEQKTNSNQEFPFSPEDNINNIF